MLTDYLPCARAEPSTFSALTHLIITKPYQARISIMIPFLQIGKRRDKRLNMPAITQPVSDSCSVSPGLWLQEWVLLTPLLVQS